jgi:TonB family protein
MVRLGFFLFFCSLLASNAVSQQCDSIARFGFNAEALPLYKGELREFVQNSIVYPQRALQDTIEGKVFVTFIVDTLGITMNHCIAKGVRDDLDQEALRIARLIKYEKPAMRKGKPIYFEITIPIVFCITSENEY